MWVKAAYKSVNCTNHVTKKYWGETVTDLAPLHLALEKKNITIAIVLLQAGADCEQQAVIDSMRAWTLPAELAEKHEVFEAYNFISYTLAPEKPKKDLTTNLGMLCMHFFAAYPALSLYYYKERYPQRFTQLSNQEGRWKEIWDHIGVALPADLFNEFLQKGSA